MQYYCFKREAVTFPTAKTVLTNHLRSQRKSPLGEREDGDEVGTSGCKVGHERQMSLKSKRSPHIVGLGSHGRPLRHVWESKIQTRGRVRNQGMECESLLLF